MRLRNNSPMLEFSSVVDEENQTLMNAAVVKRPLAVGPSDDPLTSSLLDVCGRRFSVLLLLMLLQSLSSFELQRFADLLAKHIEITLFLTMLVGAGGNCSNQSAVLVIRGLATGSLPFTGAAIARLVRRELVVGIIIAALLGVVGFGRVYFFLGDETLAAAVASANTDAGSVAAANSPKWLISLAISLSLFIIVLASVVVGTLLPLALHHAGLDPAHAGPSVQVVMDVAGVLITCVVCDRVLR